MLREASIRTLTSTESSEGTSQHISEMSIRVNVILACERGIIVCLLISTKWNRLPDIETR